MQIKNLGSCVGIDQVIVNKIRVVDIDLDKARQTPGLELNMDKSGPVYQTESGKEFCSLKIKLDPFFSQMYFGHTSGTKGNRSYGSVTVSPTNLFGDNVQNMSMFELLIHIDFIQKYVEETYGILISFEDAEFKKMELNATFLLKYPYNEYRPAAENADRLFPYAPVHFSFHPVIV